MTDILIDEWLNDFFSATDNNNIIKRRESSYIEFKSVFDWQTESSRAAYCKSLAAFSNNSGGALFFGIENKPHKIVGVKNFEDIDDADITNYINEIFTPHIQFERKTYEYNGMIIGILYSPKKLNRDLLFAQKILQKHILQISILDIAQSQQK